MGQRLGGRTDGLVGRLDAAVAQPARRIRAVGCQQVVRLARCHAGELSRPERVAQGEVAFDVDHRGHPVRVLVREGHRDDAADGMPDQVDAGVGRGAVDGGAHVVDLGFDRDVSRVGFRAVAQQIGADDGGRTQQRKSAVISQGADETVYEDER